MIHYETEGAVARVTIDRPEVANAVDRPTAEALADAFRRFDADDELAVAVLTGAGGKFCAGADLKAMQEPAAPRRSKGDAGAGPPAAEPRRTGWRRSARGDADAAVEACDRGRRGQCRRG